MRAEGGHEGKEETTTQEECVEVKKETNSMHEESDVSNRHMTWWRHTCGRREAVDEHGEQPEEQPNRLAMMVEETQSPAEEAEGEKWRRRKGERQTRQRSENNLHL